MKNFIKYPISGGTFSIMRALENGAKAYEDAVRKMSDAELYAHCFDDGDVKEGDFCLAELSRRGIVQETPRESLSTNPKQKPCG